MYIGKDLKKDIYTCTLYRLGYENIKVVYIHEMHYAFDEQINKLC